MGASCKTAIATRQTPRIRATTRATALARCATSARLWTSTDATCHLVDASRVSTSARWTRSVTPTRRRGRMAARCLAAPACRRFAQPGVRRASSVRRTLRRMCTVASMWVVCASRYRCLQHHHGSHILTKLPSNAQCSVLQTSRATKCNRSMNLTATWLLAPAFATRAATSVLAGGSAS